MAAKDDDLQEEDDSNEEDFDSGSSPASDDEDIKYTIGTIVVDDGSAEEYTEVEEDFVAAPAPGAAPSAEDAVDEEEKVNEKDEFLDEANVDLDDPERYWDS
jgi:hypothetical protein